MAILLIFPCGGMNIYALIFVISLTCVTGLELLISEVIASGPSTNRFRNVPSGFSPEKPAQASAAAVAFSTLKRGIPDNRMPS